MNPVLIVKTANGFAFVEYTGDVPSVSLSEVMCFGELEDSYAYRNDGLMAAVKKHFTPMPDATLSEVPA